MSLEEAISLAAEAHHGQVDKGGQPYILHPLRVMMKFKDPRHQIVAVLHDTIEDTFVNEDLLFQADLDPELIAALYALSRQDGEPYHEFIERAGANEIARLVKIADLEDNLDPSRTLPNPSAQDVRRVLKYQASLVYLQGLKKALT